VRTVGELDSLQHDGLDMIIDHYHLPGAGLRRPEKLRIIRRYLGLPGV
jgi:hypothetical protein